MTAVARHIGHELGTRHVIVRISPRPNETPCLQSGGAGRVKRRACLASREQAPEPPGRAFVAAVCCCRFATGASPECRACEHCSRFPTRQSGIHGRLPQQFTLTGGSRGRWRTDSTSAARGDASARDTDALTDPWVLTASACTNSTSTIPIVMLIPRPPARKQMNIACGRRLSIISRSAPSSLSFSAGVNASPKNAAFTG
jgi:hypothetical protein